jgi:hypothetical protein
VNGAQTNHSSLTVLGGGNVVTNGATVTNTLQLGGIAAGSWLRATNTPSAGQMLYATDTSPTNLYFGAAPAGGGTGNQTPVTANVDWAGFSATNILSVVSTAAVGQVAFQMPMGAVMRWYSNASNYVDQYAVSVGQMYFVSVSNNLAVTNIMQVNP